MKKKKEVLRLKSKILFQHIISSTSRKIQLTNDQINAHFLRNEKKREKIIEEQNNKYTFQPKIENIYHFDQNFEERQMFYSEISEKHMKQ